MTADPAERVQMLTAGGRVLRVATRDGDPGRPPLLLLCNGIGGSLQLFGPFVDALDPRRGVIRFDMPRTASGPQFSVFAQTRHWSGAWEPSGPRFFDRFIATNDRDQLPDNYP